MILSDLNKKLFLIPPTRIGRHLGLAMDRSCSLRWQEYTATGLWRSWKFLWFRVYWWFAE